MNKFRIIVFTLIAGIVVVGCEDTTVEPFENSNGAYTVYGAINTDSTTNYVRIKDAQSPLLAPLEELETFSVSFENLDTGESQNLDKEIVFFNNYPTFNFIIEDSLTPRTPYRLTITGDDGEVATSVATTPGVTTLSMTPAVTETCFEPILIEFDNVQDPEFIRFELGARYQGSTFFGEIRSVDQLEKVNGTNKVAVILSITNMLVDVSPPVAESTVGLPPFLWTPTVSCGELDERNLIIRYTHFGPEWEVLEQNTLPLDVLDSGDIQNGLGFFGAVDRGELRFTSNGIPQ
jgi:hypothetical protein